MSDASATGMGLYSNAHYYTQITDTNRAGWIWIAGLLSLLYPVFSGFVRFHVRRGSYGADDWVLTAATVRTLAFGL